MKIKANPQKNTLLKNAQANATSNFFKRVFFSSTQEKLKNKKSPTLQKNKTSFQRTILTLTDTSLHVNRFGQSALKCDTSPLRTDRRASGNSTYPKGGVSCFANTFMRAESSLLRMKILEKIPPFG